MKISNTDVLIIRKKKSRKKAIKKQPSHGMTPLIDLEVFTQIVLKMYIISLRAG